MTHEADTLSEMSLRLSSASFTDVDRFSIAAALGLSAARIRPMEEFVAAHMAQEVPDVLPEKVVRLPIVRVETRAVR